MRVRARKRMNEQLSAEERWTSPISRSEVRCPVKRNSLDREEGRRKLISLRAVGDDLKVA